jgi:nicotinate-nucleotide adenylyltransferase
VSAELVNIGILGGSFDPIHFGHIKPSISLAEQFNLQKIRLIPCKVSPFKDKTHASAQDRWNMISVVAGSSDLFVADARELKRDTPSYTYLSLLELADEYAGKAKLFFIIGGDALNDLPKWYEAEKIMQLCHVLVAPRQGFELTKDPEKLKWLNRYLCDDKSLLEKSIYGHIYITDTELVEVSSTQIRQTIKSGEQPRYLVPGGVWNYIRRNQLYANAL